MEVNLCFWFYRWAQRSIKKKTELLDGTKNEIETISGGKVGQYRKFFMKTKFYSYDKLPLNKKIEVSNNGNDH